MFVTGKQDCRFGTQTNEYLWWSDLKTRGNDTNCGNTVIHIYGNIADSGQYVSDIIIIIIIIIISDVFYGGCVWTLSPCWHVEFEHSNLYAQHLSLVKK